MALKLKMLLLFIMLLPSGFVATAVAQVVVVAPSLPAGGFLENNHFYLRPERFDCTETTTLVTSGPKKNMCKADVPVNSIIRGNKDGSSSVYIPTTATICPSKEPPVSLHIGSTIKKFCSILTIPKGTQFDFKPPVLYIESYAVCPSPLSHSDWDGRGCLYIQLPPCVIASDLDNQWTYTPIKSNVKLPDFYMWDKARVRLDAGTKTFSTTSFPRTLESDFSKISLRCLPEGGAGCPDTLKLLTSPSTVLVNLTNCASGCIGNINTTLKAGTYVFTVQGDFVGTPAVGSAWRISLSFNDPEVHLKYARNDFRGVVATPGLFIPGELIMATIHYNNGDIKDPFSTVGGQNGKEPSLTVYLDALSSPSGAQVKISLPLNEKNAARIFGNGVFTIPACHQAETLSWFLGTKNVTKGLFKPAEVRVGVQINNRAMLAVPEIKIE